MLGGLALTLTVIHSLLRRRFIKPALTLVDYLREEAAGQPPLVLPTATVLWRPWFEVITTTFANNRHYVRTIQDLNTDLERRVEERTEQLQEANRELRLEIEVRQRVQNALQAAKAEVESANQAKSTFMANMSHEFRTPLNSILGYTQILLRDTGLSEKQREHIKAIHQAGEHLSSLVNELLDLSQIETPDMEAFIARRTSLRTVDNAASVVGSALSVLPVAAEMTALRWLAQRGDIKNLLAQLERLEQSNADFQPFVQQIRALAQSFQVNQIVRLLGDPRIQP